ncbi:MAG: phosphatase PAP2 family protein, partial [Clostridia bacterium]|nr:phosphatase PAP2 family protein [Clostridia bacterium]
MLSQLNRWELGILDWIRDFFGAPFLDTAVPIFTMLGNAGWIWIVISILLMCLPKHRKAGITLAVGLICQLVVCNLLLKNLIARDRPCWINEAVTLLVENPTDFSFPSGHTMVSFIAAT